MSGTLAVKLTWERLGRKESNPRHDGYEEIITVPDTDDFGDDLVAAIYRIARRHLNSSDFAIHAHALTATCTHDNTTQPVYNGGNYGNYGTRRCKDCGASRDDWSDWSGGTGMRDMNAGTFSIEGDRFGKGRWAVVTTVSDGSAP